MDRGKRKISYRKIDWESLLPPETFKCIQSSWKRIRTKASETPCIQARHPVMKIDEYNEMKEKEDEGTQVHTEQFPDRHAAGVLIITTDASFYAAGVCLAAVARTNTLEFLRAKSIVQRRSDRRRDNTNYYAELDAVKEVGVPLAHEIIKSHPNTFRSAIFCTDCKIVMMGFVYGKTEDGGMCILQEEVNHLRLVAGRQPWEREGVVRVDGFRPLSEEEKPDMDIKFIHRENNQPANGIAKLRQDMDEDRPPAYIEKFLEENKFVTRYYELRID